MSSCPELRRHNKAAMVVVVAFWCRVPCAVPIGIRHVTSTSLVTFLQMHV
jgi:hypothetical protein